MKEQEATAKSEGSKGAPESGKKEDETLIRLAADFENYKKRTAKEFIEQKDSGKREIIEKLLSLSDTFELALVSVKNASPDVLKGFIMMQNQLKSLLTEEGAIPFGEKGEPFDPFRHDAVEFVEGSPESEVSEVIQKGYTFRGKILRPCTVKVFRKGSDSHAHGEKSPPCAEVSEESPKEEKKGKSEEEKNGKDNRN